MKLLSYLRSVAAKFFHRSQIEDEMEEELRSHIQHRADDLERSGLHRAEAERRARIEFGGRERFKEECREALGGNFIETLYTDMRFSLRVLRKSPGFTIVAVLTLALAIGANAVVFGMLNGLILRPLNVPQAESLYGIERSDEDNAGTNRIPTISTCATATAASRVWPLIESSRPGWIRAKILRASGPIEVSGNYFDALRIQPLSWPFLPCLR